MIGCLAKNLLGHRVIRRVKQLRSRVKSEDKMKSLPEHARLSVVEVPEAVV